MLLALAIAGLFVLPDPWRIVVLAVAAVVEIAEVFFWIRFLERYRITTGAEGLVGERAEVIAPCDPDGRARVRGEIWRARAERSLEEGEAARVSAVDGLTLVLERMDASPK